jgi:hypothetical protein
MHADAEQEAMSTAALRERFQPEELLITESTSVMGAHTGPGFVGVAFFSGEPWSGGMSSAPSPADDVSRLETALGELPARRPAPFLVLVSGLPGSGKSHFSRELCRRYPLAHLNSDALRRALFPQPTHSTDESARLFAAVHALLERPFRAWRCPTRRAWGEHRYCFTISPSARARPQRPHGGAGGRRPGTPGRPRPRQRSGGRVGGVSGRL